MPAFSERIVGAEGRLRLAFRTSSEALEHGKCRGVIWPCKRSPPKWKKYMYLLTWQVALRSMKSATALPFVTEDSRSRLLPG